MQIKALHKLIGFCNILVVLLLPVTLSAQEDIAGIVNEYFEVVNIDLSQCPPEISTAEEHSLAPGEKLLLIQMNGVSCNLDLSYDYGMIEDYGSAGNYEFLTVEETATNTFRPTTILSNSYDTSFAVQIVKVPVYESATVVGDLLAQPWDGTVGGILAIHVIEELVLNGNLLADGAGFRGGTRMFDTGFPCEAFDLWYDESQALASEKGEGLFVPDPSMQYGMGAQANAGGGGNKSNSGGGGGSNFSAGGSGGFQSAECAILEVGGMGGWQLDDFEKKAFMGGGGGAGHAEAFDSDGNPQATAGTNGGGLIFIKAGVLEGNSYSISAAGLDQNQVALASGGGGGGAGGTVVFEVASFAGLLTLKVNGGKGGNVDGDQYAVFDCFGPGGGGGAGVLKINASSSPEGILNLASQGLAGVEVNVSSNCFNENNGAENGTSPQGLGVVDSFYTEDPEPILDLQDEPFSFCEGDSVFVEVPDLFQDYLWNNGETTPGIWLKNPGTYTLQVSSSCGPKEDQLTVLDHPSFQEPNFPSDTTLCSGQTLQLDLAGLYSAQLWPDGTNATTFSTDVEGAINVVVWNEENCEKQLTIMLNFVESEILDLGPDQYFCNAESATFMAPDGYVEYRWSNEESTQSLNLVEAGYYNLQVLDANGCNSEDEIYLGFREAPSPEIPTIETICEGQVKYIDPGYFNQYLWSDGSTERILQLTQPGSYSLEVTDEFECSTTVQMEVSTLCQVGIQVVNAFSPNGDGVNDVFRVITSSVEEFELTVHDRWGKTLFRSTSSTDGWDGDFNGEALPIGTYVWSLQAVVNDNGKLIQENRSGNVTLLR